MKGVRPWLYHLWSSQFFYADPGSFSQELHFSWALASFAADLQGLRHKCDDILFQTPVSEFLPLNH
jgi:hypothetical protein